MQHLHELALAIQITKALGWNLLSCQGDFFSGMQIGFAPSLVDPSCCSCLKRETIPRVQGVLEEVETGFSYGG